MYKRASNFYKSNIKLIRFNFSALVLFLLVFKMLSALVFYPLVLLGLNFSIERAGLGYLTLNNLVQFVTSPLSIITAFLLMISITILAVYELVVLTICFEMSRNEKKVNALELAYAGLFKMKKLIRPNSVLFFFVMLPVVSLLDLPFASSLISISALSAFIFDYISGSWPLFLFVLFLALFLLWWFGVYLMSIHHVLLDGGSTRNAMKKMLQMVHGKRLKITLRMLFWYVSIFFFFIIIYLIIILIFGGFSRFLVPGNEQLTVFLTATRIVGSGLTIIMYSFFTPLFLAFITSYYHVLRKDYFANEEEDITATPIKIKKFKRHNVILILLILALTVSNAGVIYQSFADGIMRQVAFARVPDITAHRGSSRRAPENTLSAVGLAIEEYADYSEIDVWQMADDTIVLMHDENLVRTTGKDAMVWDISYDEIAHLEAGSYFSEAFAGEPIPTLEDVFEFVENDIKLNIDIKASVHTPDLARNVAELIVEYDFIDRCVVTSFDHQSLIDVKAVDPDIQTGLIMVMPTGRYTQLEAVDFYSIHFGFVSVRQIEYLHRIGREVHVWGPSSPQEISRMIDYGVDNIISSDPLLVRETAYAQYADPLVILVANLLFEDAEIFSKPTSFFPLRF